MNIRPRVFEVYPDDIYLSEKKKPDPGEKLNKECIVELYHIFPKNKLYGMEKFKRQLI